jgi:hypothetical protein
MCSPPSPRRAPSLSQQWWFTIEPTHPWMGGWRPTPMPRILENQGKWTPDHLTMEVWGWFERSDERLSLLPRTSPKQHLECKILLSHEGSGHRGNSQAMCPAEWWLCTWWSPNKKHRGEGYIPSNIGTTDMLQASDCMCFTYDYYQWMVFYISQWPSGLHWSCRSLIGHDICVISDYGWCAINIGTRDLLQALNVTCFANDYHQGRDQGVAHISMAIGTALM